MKTIILAGGFGTRLSEYTGSIPKPMVSIGGNPILWHIMNTYASHGHKDFYLALGYKAEVIKEYFMNYSSFNSDFSVDMKTGKVDFLQSHKIDWNVTLVDTGLNSMTGGRVKRMREFIGNETFMLTYGDGLSNVDITALIDFHKSHGKMVTVSAVHPAARFGEIDMIDNGLVTSFKEKPQINQGWINGGYFVIEPDFFDFIDGDSTVLEGDPLERASKQGELVAYRHEGFWQCMDTKRDRDLLEELHQSGNPPWIR
jgi:glucose-1-phosphate cytidylyltransferase